MTAAVTHPRASAGRADVLALLGLVGHLELTAFTRLAADSALAPTLDQQLRLVHFSAGAVARLDRVVARITELGGSPQVELARFARVLDDFDARTTPGSWWERLLTAYVGYGVADDFCKAAAAGLDDDTRDLVMDVLDGASHAELTVATLAAAAADDEVLTSRLALWGRRLVGEALGVVQNLLVTEPSLARLALPAPGEPDATAPSSDAVGDASVRLFGRLTAEHTRRMGRLGLTA
ncbi:ferritin-like fold-containing protein [uncultured Cellulomonas sp.]|uniref:ferritin-like fold-containing protein n=1 Tax=uncultured Cellulomonas sp. TaxID=189682 RepID=UPI00261EBB0A|nr:ferritin-like fold-containing protein [uncultured Cellulomonas sp.]